MHDVNWWNILAIWKHIFIRPFYMSVPSAHCLIIHLCYQKTWNMTPLYTVIFQLWVALVTSLARDWPSVVKTACEVSQPRRLHAVQVYRPLSSFFTRWIVRVRFCWLRITPVSNTYCFFFLDSCGNLWRESAFNEKPCTSHLSPPPQCGCFLSTPPLGLASQLHHSGEWLSHSR